MHRTNWFLLMALVWASSATAVHAQAACRPVDIVPVGTPIPPPEDSFTVANDLNNWGQVVGRTVLGVSRAFVWQHGRIRLLPGLIPSGSSNAAAINDLDRIVGSAEDVQSRSVPVTWTIRGIATLPSDGPGVAVDINNRGQIVGNSAAGCLLWRDAQSQPSLLTGFDGDFCEVTAIDEHGAIVGRASHADGRVFGFVWEDGAVIDINASAGGEGLVYSELWDIDNGVAIGIGDPAEGRRSGLVWTETAGRAPPGYHHQCAGREPLGRGDFDRHRDGRAVRADYPAWQAL